MKTLIRQLTGWKAIGGIAAVAGVVIMFWDQIQILLWAAVVTLMLVVVWIMVYLKLIH